MQFASFHNICLLHLAHALSPSVYHKNDLQIKGTDTSIKRLKIKKKKINNRVLRKGEKLYRITSKEKRKGRNFVILGIKNIFSELTKLHGNKKGKRKKKEGKGKGNGKGKGKGQH